MDPAGLLELWEGHKGSLWPQARAVSRQQDQDLLLPGGGAPRPSGCSTACVALGTQRPGLTPEADCSFSSLLRFVGGSSARSSAHSRLRLERTALEESAAGRLSEKHEVGTGFPAPSPVSSSCTG